MKGVYDSVLTMKYEMDLLKAEVIHLHMVKKVDVMEVIDFLEIVYKTSYVLVDGSLIRSECVNSLA